VAPPPPTANLPDTLIEAFDFCFGMVRFVVALDFAAFVDFTVFEDFTLADDEAVLVDFPEDDL
jgi:hypothetical protein